MRVLVTGGAGFLGQFIAEQLRDRGDQVRIFSRAPDSRLSSQGFELFSGDLRDPESIRPAVQGVESVFHVAAVPGIWGKWSTFHGINTLGTENLLQSAVEAGVSRFVFTSSPSVVYDGQPHRNADESLPYPEHYSCHYPHSKALAEQAVLAANGKQGMHTVALRPHLIWGPRDRHLIPRLIQRAQSGRLVRVGDGQNLVSVSYVENAAAAHLAAHDALGPESPCARQAYFINEPEPVRLWGWIDELLALADLPPVKRAISPSLAKGVGAVLEGVYGLLRREREPAMTRFLASQLSQTHTYSVEKAMRDFGYAPAVSFEEGMRRLAPEVRPLTK